MPCFANQSTLYLTDVMTDLYNYVNPKNGKHSPLISKETHEIIMNNADVSERTNFLLNLDLT